MNAITSNPKNGTLALLAAGSILSGGLSVYYVCQDGGLGWIGFGALAAILGWCSLWPALRSSGNPGRGLVALLGLLVGWATLSGFFTLLLYAAHVHGLR